MKNRPGKAARENKPRLMFLANAGVVHAQRWIGYFRERGYPLRWLSLDEVPSGIEARRLPVRFIHKAGAILLTVPRIKAEIHAFQPDLVNALFIPDHGWAGALTGFSPLVISAWGSDVLLSPRKSWLHRRRVSWAMARADLLFADARVITERMIALGAERRKIVTVPLGIEPALLDYRQDTSPAEDTCTVLNCRAFEPVYHHETLAEAAYILKSMSASPAYRYVLIGRGSQRDKLQKAVVEMGMADQITFQPYLSTDKLYAEMARADIYVSCAASDGTSVSLLEAMALGLYPVVTDLPANREWITDGVNGRLFPAGDAEALAQVIQEVSANRQQWPEVIERNRASIKERALWPDNMAQVERAMIRLIS